MSSILDIDLDYFGTVDDPVGRLERLLAWAGRPVGLVVDRHHHALREWRAAVRRGRLSAPTHILHVDEHHDMMHEGRQPNIANVMVRAMRRWPDCRVHWLVEWPIDSPDVWLSDGTWERLAGRFSSGPHRPPNWPRPDLVSVCTSPEFVEPDLGRRLMELVGEHSDALATRITRAGAHTGW
ncbi:MAG: UPF0489 family protein [Planctomycetota bacterium]